MDLEFAHAGFTVTELMVVIAILAILAASGIPMVTSWLPNHRLNVAARDLFSNFQLAKLTAIKRGFFVLRIPSRHCKAAG